MEDFEKKIGVFFSDYEKEDVDTVGGLVFNLLGKIPNRGEVKRIAGTKPIKALTKAVNINEIKISLFFMGEMNKFVKFLLQISSKKSMLNPILVLNRKS